MNLFVDFHCHPALKYYLFGHSVFGQADRNANFDYANIQVTVMYIVLYGKNK